MALHFNNSYLECHTCRNKVLQMEEMLLIEETKDVYYVTKTKVIVCSKCNSIVKELNKFDNKPFVEV